MRKRTLRDRAFQTFWRLRRPATLGVRGVVADDRGHVLLVRHTYTPGWHLPGGGVEKGETCAGSLRRELLEEAGIVAAEADMRLLSVHANHAFFPNDHVLVYRIGRWAQQAPVQTGEIAEIRFCDPLAPPDGVTGGTMRRLDEIFVGVAPSTAW